MALVRSAFLLALACASAVQAFVVDVSPRSEECFLSKAKAGEELHFTYEVYEGGFLDIDVKVTEQDRKTSVLYEKKRSTTDKTQWEVFDDTVYKICFSNRISTLAHKKLAFSVYTDEDIQAPAEKKHMDPLRALAIQIEEGIQDAKTKLNYMAIRENIHTATNQATSRRVMFLSVIEVIVVMIVCALQVFVLKRFFERKTRI